MKAGNLKKSIHFGNQGAYERKELRLSRGQVVFSITAVLYRVTYVFGGGAKVVTNVIVNT